VGLPQPRERLRASSGTKIKLCLPIESGINRKTRTGLFLARSTGFLASACFGKFAIADFYNLFDFFSLHFSYSFRFFNMPGHNESMNNEKLFIFPVPSIIE
jgi:hypothetical protein